MSEISSKQEMNLLVRTVDGNSLVYSGADQIIIGEDDVQIVDSDGKFIAVFMKPKLESISRGGTLKERI